MKYILALIVVAFTSNAFACVISRGSTCGGPSFPDERFLEFDKDGDKKHSLEEYKVMSPEFANEVFSCSDIDHDSYMSSKEYEYQELQCREQVEGWHKKFNYEDSN